VTRYTTEIIVNEMTMLGGKSAGDTGSGERAESTAPAASAAKRPAPAKGNFDNFDDDIPFAHHGKCGAGVSWRCM
jgi:single-strand DNA-binding protein